MDKELECLFLLCHSARCSEVTDVHLNPIKVLHAVEEILSDDAILVADGGDFVATAAYILRSVV